VRGALVVGQMALAFSLVAGAGLMMKSFVQLLRVDPGFSTQNVLAMTIDLDWSTYTTGAESREFFERLLERTRQHPQVLAAGAASDYPLSTQGFTARRSLILEGGSDRFDEGDGPVIGTRAVTDGYLEALRIPVLRGRTFTHQDHAEAPQVVVLSQGAAQQYFGSDDPVGRRVQFDRPVRQSEDPWFTVVGVVGDVKQAGLDQVSQAEVYYSYAQAGFARRLLVRSIGDPTAMARTLTDDVYAVDPRQPVSFVQTLEEAQRDSLASPRTLTILMGLFGSIALIIAAAGILGVISFSVARRTHEIGIRMALGARRDSVLRMVLKQALVLSVSGLALGTAGALFVGRLLEGHLFDVPAADPATMGAAAALLVAVAALAAYVPARRAASIDPASAFRIE
jgi:putative ABC transport system permease protein